jgi:N-ethylmaleimide reductase
VLSELSFGTLVVWGILETGTESCLLRHHSPIAGMQHFISQGMKDYEIPQEMTVPEIKQTIKDFGQAAKNAIAECFDGIQLHAANGYLPNQFLAESANQRTDD